MRRKTQQGMEWLDPYSRNQYLFSGNARIRREALENAEDGVDYYGDGIRLLYEHGLSQQGNVLNVGSGDGTEEKRMAIEFEHTGLIVGIDVPSSDSSFEDRFLASNDELKKHGKSNVAFVPGNAVSINFPDGMFNAVTWWHSGYHFPHKDRAIEESLRVLRDGGLFMNMTNGEMNKPLTHRTVSNIKARLGITEHAPLSAGFQLEESRRILKTYLKPLAEYEQHTEKHFTLENLALFMHMIDSYKSNVPEDKYDQWTKARDEEFAENILPVLESQGYITETVHRGGAIYEKREHVPSWMGRLAIHL